MTLAETQTSDAVDKVLESIEQLAVLPQVVFRIVEMTGSDTTSGASLEKAILVDPGFSTRILTMANSAYYSLPRPVKAIRDAVAFLGFRQVRELAMTACVFDMFLGKVDRGSLRRREWWKTSLDTAVAARAIAVRGRACSPDEAYTCGLLHLIGKTLLDRHKAKGYDMVDAAVEGGWDAMEAERRTFLCDHIEVAQAACLKWRLPEDVVDGLRYLPSEEEMTPLRATVALGRSLGQSVSHGASIEETFAQTHQAAGLAAEDQEAIYEAVRDAISEAHALSVGS